MTVEEVINTLFPKQQCEIMNYWGDSHTKYIYDMETANKNVRCIRANNNIIEIYFD